MDEGLFRRLQEEIELQEKECGITSADLVMLPRPLRQIMNLLTRRRVMTLEELCEATGEPAEEVTCRLTELVEMTYVREMKVAGEQKYKVIFARRRGRQIPLDLWGSLGEKVE